MSEIVYGNKYDKDLDTAEIAKRVRMDIKAAIVSGDLPKGLKTSVRMDRFAGGSSIDVRVTQVPNGFTISNPERIRWDLEHPYASSTRVLPLYTAEALALVDKLKTLLNAYNYDGSDMMTDYFNVRFYGDVRFDSDLAQADRDRVVAAVKVTAEKGWA